MLNRPAPGEVLLALLFAALGILWILAAQERLYRDLLGK